MLLHAGTTYLLPYKLFRSVFLTCTSMRQGSGKVAVSHEEPECGYSRKHANIEHPVFNPSCAPQRTSEPICMEFAKNKSFSYFHRCTERYKEVAEGIHAASTHSGGFFRVVRVMVDGMRIFMLMYTKRRLAMSSSCHTSSLFVSEMPVSWSPGCIPAS